MPTPGGRGLVRDSLVYAVGLGGFGGFAEGFLSKLDRLAPRS